MMKFSNQEFLKIASERIFTACSYWVNRLSSEEVVSLFLGGSLPLTVFKRLPPQKAIDCIKNFTRPQDFEKAFRSNFKWDDLDDNDIGEIIKILIRFDTSEMNVDSLLEKIRDWIEKNNTSMYFLGLTEGSDLVRYCEMMGVNLKYLNFCSEIGNVYFNRVCDASPNLETLK